MKEIIPLSAFLILCVFTLIISTYWLKKHDKKHVIESIESNHKMDVGKLVNIHIRNVKIGSIILIVIITLKIIYLVLKKYNIW